MALADRATDEWWDEQDYGIWLCDYYARSEGEPTAD